MLKTRNEIKEWLDKHTTADMCDGNEEAVLCITRGFFGDKGEWSINKNLEVDIDGDATILAGNLIEGKLPFQFGTVDGSFNCTFCDMTSLAGSPRIVYGSFLCSNNKLTTLEGAPDFVSTEFHCEANGIDTLKGFETKVGSYLRADSALAKEFGINTLSNSPEVSIEKNAVNLLTQTNRERREFEEQIPRKAIVLDLSNMKAAQLLIATERQAKGLPPVPQRDAGPVVAGPSQAQLKKTFKI